jgi:hypothetical protein
MVMASRFVAFMRRLFGRRPDPIVHGRAQIRAALRDSSASATAAFRLSRRDRRRLSRRLASATYQTGRASGAIR